MEAPLITISDEKCTACYTCLRICPVKAILVMEGETLPTVNMARCIGCGSCITGCAPKAMSYRSSVNEVRLLLSSGEKIALICSPSIAAEFDDITDHRKFVQMNRALGFTYVHEVSFAVDVVAYKYQHLFNELKGKYYIMSYDPVVVSYVEKYHPTLIGNLAPIVSPMIACAIIVRKLYGEDVRIVYTGPEIARKEEVKRYDGLARIDAVLTFLELRQLFQEYGIDENTLEFSDFDPPLGYKGALFPLLNGIVQAADMDENRLTSDIMTAEGRHGMIESVREFENNVKTIHRHLNVTYGNALSGPGLTHHGNKLLKEHLVIRFANKRLNNFFRHEWYNNLKTYLDLDFNCSFRADDQRLPEPSADKVREVLKLLGRKETDVLGCSECGYNSCKDFAADIARGLTTPGMCATYSLRHTISSEDTLKELNEKMGKLRNELKEAQNSTEREKEIVKQTTLLANSMLEKLRAGTVIVDHKLKILQSNTSFIRILGEEAEEINLMVPGLLGADLRKLLPPAILNLFTYVLEENQIVENRDHRIGDTLLNVTVFPIISGRIAGSIIRDMHAPEVQKAEVINRITEVIDKNLEMVQKIGFLMGEGASDIEKMLNSIIEFYQTGKGEKQ